jgi:hypothetical protein
MIEASIQSSRDILRETRAAVSRRGIEGDLRPGVDHVLAIHSGYREHMTGLGYEDHPPVALTSGVDPTVRFIGSHISVLKPYLLDRTVPEDGYILVQDCLRTRNVQTLLDDDYFPKYGSFFTSLGGIAPPESLDKVCADVATFITDELGIPRENIRANVSSSDEDLLAACNRNFSPQNIHYDTKDPAYYTHRVGIEGIGGRNFNIAIPSPVSDTYEDIGNIIMIESETGQLGVEIALGDSTTLKQLYGLDHILDAYDLQLPRPQLDPALVRKMEDAIMTSVVLFQEGLRPDASNNKTRILRSYCKALAYYRRRAGMSFDELEQIIFDTESSRLPTQSENVHGHILEFIRSYDQQLNSEQVKSKEDERILRNLGKHGVISI